MEHSTALTALLSCGACGQLLFEPTTLPCGASVCRRCLRVPSSLSREPETSLATEQQQVSEETRVIALIGAYVCPAKACKKRHRYREEKTDILLSRVLSLMCPAETRAYELLRDADGELAKWWTPEDVSSPSLPSVEVTRKRSQRLVNKQKKGDKLDKESYRQDSPPIRPPRKRKERSPEKLSQSSSIAYSPESAPSKTSVPSSCNPEVDEEKLETSTEPANGSGKIPRLGSSSTLSATAESTRILSSTTTSALQKSSSEDQKGSSVEKSPNHSHHHHAPSSPASNLEAHHSDKEEALFGLVTKYILPAIALAPKLQLSYIIRAKLYAELRLFDLARQDAQMASRLAPGNRRGLVAEKLVSWKEKRALNSCTSKTSGNRCDCAQMASRLAPGNRRGLVAEKLVSWKEKGALNSCTSKTSGNCCDCCVASVSVAPELLLDAASPTPPTWESAQESLEAEVECTLCLNVLEHPVTSPCGHTWCHSCICRSVDHSRQCPLCRTKLPGSGFFHSRSVNTTIQALISLVYPPSIPTALSTPPLVPSNKTSQVPIFVCSLVFPGAKQGFHVFEPRYRVMLKRCMETMKRFGICLPGLWQGDFAEYGTMVEITHFHPISGEVVDTAEGPLPRVMVETRGLYAFRVKNKAVDMSGYHLADIERVFDIEPEEEWAEVSQSSSTSAPSSSVLDSKDLVGLVTKARSNVLSLLSPLDPVAKSHLEAEKGSLPDDLSDFTFWIADILPINPYQGYELLKLASVRSRLELICRWMDAAAANRSLPRT